MGEYSKLKHIITGGDGFLGKELARKLIELEKEVIILDINKTDDEIYRSKHLEHIFLDITKLEDYKKINFEADDVVYHLASKVIIPIVPIDERFLAFWSAIYLGTKTLLNFLEKNTDCRNIVYTTSDMVYGRPHYIPIDEMHPKRPIGPYGFAKLNTERLCDEYREKGFRITIFRPRLIIGKGRLGIFVKLFRLIDANLPIPLIGDGKNCYQFISVSDCADGMIRAVEKKFPNTELNLGSINPPKVNDLLWGLIKHAQSNSFPFPTPATLCQNILAALDLMNQPLLTSEQFMITSENCILNMKKTETELEWLPEDKDTEMLICAYDYYKKL